MDLRNIALYSKKTGCPQTIQYWKLDSSIDEKAFRCAIDMFLHDDSEMEGMRISRKLNDDGGWIVELSTSEKNQ